jgi:hypothetical protein
MALKTIYKMGEGYVPAYQLSATPFVTSSNISLGEIKQYNFSYVTRFFVIKNTGAAGETLAISFTENGFDLANSNFFTLDSGESFAADIRCDRLFLSGATAAPTFSIVAGLTQIASSEFLVLTSSNGFQGVG